MASVLTNAFFEKVVGKYWPSSGWSPLVAQGILVGLPILLVTSVDLLPRRLRRCLRLKYDGHLSFSSLLLALAKALLSEI